MRTCLFSCFLFCLFHSVHAQDLQDSLSKYSYLVQTDKQCEKSAATGFFVRYDKRLFFVTAAHCLTGWDPVSLKNIDGFPDTIYIRLSNDTSKFSYLPLPVNGIKKTAKAFRDSETPDVVVVEIKNPRKYSVFSIEDYFEEDVPCEVAKKVLVSGYTNEGRDDYFRLRQQPSVLTSSLDNTYCYYPYRPDLKLYDRLHYFAKLGEKQTMAGLSGAPVYIITGNQSIVFGGLYIGGAQDEATAAKIIRPEYVINKIKARIFE